MLTSQAPHFLVDISKKNVLGFQTTGGHCTNPTNASSRAKHSKISHTIYLKFDPSIYSPLN